MTFDPTPAIRRMRAPMHKPVLQIDISSACDLRECSNCTRLLTHYPIWRMTLENFRSAIRSLDGYPGVVGVFGGNPSLASGTKVYTTAGIFPIEYLEGKQFTVRNLDGQESPAICRLSGHNKHLYKIVLRGGHAYYATAEHEWPTSALIRRPTDKRSEHEMYNIRKFRTDELEPGMCLPVNRSLSLGFGVDGDKEDGFLAGWLLGDGWISRRPQRTTPLPTTKRGAIDKRFSENYSATVGLIVNQQDHDSGIADRLSSRIKTFGSKASWRATQKCYELQTAMTAIDEWMENFGIISKSEGLPSSVWSTASEDFRIGVLDGLFSSDGHVEVSNKRGFARARLTTAHKKMATDVAELLGFYGIKTSIRTRVRERSCFPNGKDYGKSYTSHDVSIEGTADVEHFTKLVRLTHDEKRRRLEAAVGSHRADITSGFIEIQSVEKTDRRENVWDISVNDDTHCFQIAHCITGNCVHPQFEEFTREFARLRPNRQLRGLWTNNYNGHGAIIADPVIGYGYRNLNVHMDQGCADEMKQAHAPGGVLIHGMDRHAAHSPILVAMRDMVPDEQTMWGMIEKCDINLKWSGCITQRRGQLRTFFCEVASSFDHMYDLDTGGTVYPEWWKCTMEDNADFREQARMWCPQCGVPLKMEGHLDNAAVDDVSKSHLSKVQVTAKGRKIVVHDSIDQGKTHEVTDYMTYRKPK